MWREDEDQSNRDHPPMASDAASDLFAMLTPTQASPDALASAPASASDAPAGVGESTTFAHSETPASYSHGGDSEAGAEHVTGIAPETKKSFTTESSLAIATAFLR